MVFHSFPVLIHQAHLPSWKRIQGCIVCNPTRRSPLQPETVVEAGRMAYGGRRRAESRAKPPGISLSLLLLSLTESATLSLLLSPSSLIPTILSDSAAFQPGHNGWTPPCWLAYIYYLSASRPLGDASTRLHVHSLYCK